jgi:hypothetical protein
MEWRRFLGEFETTCDDLSAEGIASCAKIKVPDDMLIDLGKLTLTDFTGCMRDSDDLESVDDEVLKSVGRATSELVIIKGDQWEAAGTADPSFFSMHTTLARYYQLQMLLPLGPVDNWSDVDGTFDACITTCYTLEGEVSDDAEVCCAGHFSYSTYYEEVDANVFGVNEADSDVALTNRDVLEKYLDPTSGSVDQFIFHHLKWDHCDDDFGQLAEAQLESME